MTDRALGGADAAAFVAETIGASIAVKQSLRALIPDIVRAADLLVDAYRRGGKAIFFGNGGSAADAQHLAAELEHRFTLERRPLPALALHTNPSTVTAVANDRDYGELFARLLRAHARPEDVAVAITTSGTSRNVLAAAEVKRDIPFRLVALTGEHGAPLARLADVVVAVPSRSTPRVQEAHILIGHVLCEWVERSLFGGAGPAR
jgi:D-sedoheptulose 7-phosphate isomerase